jgi:hypothetical protein
VGADRRRSARKAVDRRQCADPKGQKTENPKTKTFPKKAKPQTECRAGKHRGASLTAIENGAVNTPIFYAGDRVRRQHADPDRQLRPGSVSAARSSGASAARSGCSMARAPMPRANRGWRLLPCVLGRSYQVDIMFAISSIYACYSRFAPAVCAHQHDVPDVGARDHHAPVRAPCRRQSGGRPPRQGARLTDRATGVLRPGIGFPRACSGDM